MARISDQLRCVSPIPEGTLREIQINLLECKVCFETFNSQQRERRPQTLSCGHVLCLECITALAHPLLKELECPFCRRLCSVDSASHCQVLIDLQELLLSHGPSSSSPPKEDCTSGCISTTLQLQTAFGGWGTLVNPTGIAASGSPGTVIVAHDGKHGLVVFSLLGRKLHSFGKRGKGMGEISYPMDVAVTPGGYVVVTDAGDKAVKVFTSRGNHVLTVKDRFQLPWGVGTHISGHMTVSDAKDGTLSMLKLDYSRSAVDEIQTVVSDLQCPKAVACCPVTGNVAVVEYLAHVSPSAESHCCRRLRVFSADFHLLHLIDSFSLTLQSSVRLIVSGVMIDRNGDVIVIDSDQGFICSLGNLQNGPVISPLVGNHLVRPVGLLALNNLLITLDAGDHTVKIYSAKPTLLDL